MQLPRRYIMPRRAPTKPPEPPPPSPPVEDLGETREERFARIAPRRVNHLLDHIRIFGNLSNRANYDWPQEWVDRIFDEIQRAIDDTKALFLRGRRPKFHL
jgi:hypothetical protein